MIVVNVDELKKMDVVSLKQACGCIHKMLVEGDSEPETSPGAKEITDALHDELAAVDREIRTKEGKLQKEGEEARAKFHNQKGEYETGVILTPKQSVRSYEAYR
jgi:hypothetical protein